MIAREAIHWAHDIAHPNEHDSDWKLSNPKKIEGDPVNVIAVGGWMSPDSRDLSHVRQAVASILPEGSSVGLHRFGTIFNVALFKDLRKDEEKLLGEEMEEKAEAGGGPVLLFGHSLGGLIALEAWLDHPRAARGLIAAGTPFKWPGVGNTEKPENGEIVTIYGTHDLVVLGHFSEHPKEVEREKVIGGHVSLVHSNKGYNAIAAGTRRLLHPA